ncbi:hypothetical protein [Kosakonia oryzendophytica]
MTVLTEVIRTVISGIQV